MREAEAEVREEDLGLRSSRPAAAMADSSSSGLKLVVEGMETTMEDTGAPRSSSTASRRAAMRAVRMWTSVVTELEFLGCVPRGCWLAGCPESNSSVSSSLPRHLEAIFSRSRASMNNSDDVFPLTDSLTCQTCIP